MMSGDNFTQEVSQTRPVLGDLTNRPSKRELSSVSGDFRFKSRCGYHKKVATHPENLHFAKRVCSGVENTAKETHTEIGDNTDAEKGLSLTEDKEASELSDTDTSQISNRPNENKDKPILLNSSVNFPKRGTVTRSVDEVGDASRDSCASTGSMPANFWSCKKDSYEGWRLTSDAKQKNQASDVCTIGEKELGGGRLSSGNFGSVEGSRMPNSQGSISFALDRCAALKGDGRANLSAGDDLLKACSCSFCKKAAYIWSDLHYQDIKGRMAVLKKSQKEASILALKYAGGRQAENHGQGNSSKSSNLESDLTAQWTSLFYHMEDIFVHESNQLQSGYVALKDLREACKMDLERTTGLPSDKS